MNISKETPRIAKALRACVNAGQKLSKRMSPQVDRQPEVDPQRTGRIQEVNPQKVVNPPQRKNPAAV